MPWGIPVAGIVTGAGGTGGADGAASVSETQTGTRLGGAAAAAQSTDVPGAAPAPARSEAVKKTAERIRYGFPQPEGCATTTSCGCSGIAFRLCGRFFHSFSRSRLCCAYNLHQLTLQIAANDEQFAHLERLHCVADFLRGDDHGRIDGRCVHRKACGGRKRPPFSFRMRRGRALRGIRE